MKSTVIMTSPRYRLTSYGNGTAYQLEDMRTNTATFVQGDDAETFRNQLETVEHVYPDYTTEQVLCMMWDNHGYGDLAECASWCNGNAKMNDQEMWATRDELSHAVTRYDRKQSHKAKTKGEYYNIYALSHYAMAVDRVMDSMGKGQTLAEAIFEQFNGALLWHLIMWFSDNPRQAMAARRMPKGSE